jgi:hypothetical protein
LFTETDKSFRLEQTVEQKQQAFAINKKNYKQLFLFLFQISCLSKNHQKITNKKLRLDGARVTKTLIQKKQHNKKI